MEYLKDYIVNGLKLYEVKKKLLDVYMSEINTSEVKESKNENSSLKEFVAEILLDNRDFKTS